MVGFTIVSVKFRNKEHTSSNETSDNLSDRKDGGSDKREFPSKEQAKRDSWIELTTTDVRKQVNSSSNTWGRSGLLHDH